MSDSQLTRMLQKHIVDVEDRKVEAHAEAIRRANLASPANANAMVERLLGSIRHFEERLDAEHEVGAQLASFGQSITIAIDEITFHNPDLLRLHGTTPEGQPCTLLQHVSQTNILLVALKVQDGRSPRRIGFYRDDEEG